MELLLRLIELIIVYNNKKRQRAALEARRLTAQKRVVKRAVGYRGAPVNRPKEKHDWDDKIVRLR